MEKVNKKMENILQDLELIIKLDQYLFYSGSINDWIS